MFEDFILDDIDSIDSVDDQISIDDIDSDGDNGDWTDSFIEDEIPEFTANNDDFSLDPENSSSSTDNLESQDKDGSPISFKGYLHCEVKGCGCGGYNGTGYGNFCQNCKHSFFHHH